MKALALGFALLVAAVATIAVWVSLGSRGERPAELVAAPPSGEHAERADDERLTRLEQRVNELAAEVEGLRMDLDRLGSARRSAAPEEPRAEPAPAPAGVETPTPRWYLEQYVASFAGGGQGSEYFRLAVEAFAPSLLQEIGAIVLDPRAQPTLRLRLLEMLGDPRFQRDERALALLLRVVSSAAEESLIEAALEALGRNGDALTGRALERLVWSLAGGSRLKALVVLVHLAGPEGNATVLRLFPAADDETARAYLVSLLQPNEWSSALGVFELASVQAKNVRLQAASAIGRFRFPEIRAFVDEWIAREPDDEVRAALGEARTAQSQVPAWSAAKATGAPDARLAADDRNAWASLQADMGEQWLELGFENPMPASSVRIFEGCVAGAVTRVTAID